MKRISVILLACLFAAASLPAQKIQSPRDYFGFQMGADRKLINWEQIVDYFQRLDAASGRVKLTEIGRTTQNRPMIMAIIASEEAQANLEKYREIQEQLARPFDLDPQATEPLIAQGKLVFIITLNIHSTEIAASQESVELAYELATHNDLAVQKILQNVIILLVPSLNPDGQDMISKWYMKYVGTPYEGGRMPFKYHFYADHDNNRDWFFFNLAESRNVAKVLYHDWYPEIVLDQHQMGSNGARLFLPPYSDPVNPNVAPELMAAVNSLGKHVVADLQNEGFTGLVTGTIFNAFFEGTMSKTPLWQNRIGILTEAASARIATPLFFPKTSLRGMGQDLPEYKQQTNFLDPWPGGWWRLRHIIEYEKAATYSMLDLAATYKAKYLRRFYRLNRKAIKAGQNEPPFAYVLPQDQWDPNNAVELLKRLRIANVDVYQAEEDFRAGGRQYSSGDFVVPLAQPARAYIKDLMERQHYPNLREYPGGPPRRPYDITGWTLPLQMGVEAAAIAEPFAAKMRKVNQPALNMKPVNPSSRWYAVERRFSNSYKLINRLLKEKQAVAELKEAWEDYPAGTFILERNGNNRDLLEKFSRKFQAPLRPLKEKPVSKMEPVRPLRIGIYQPWIPFVYDEGWLRLVLDEFGFDYQVIHNADFAGRKKLNDRFDLIIFGSQPAETIVKGMNPDTKMTPPGTPQTLPEYRGGIGKEGIRSVNDFINNGGRALFFNRAVNFAIQNLKLPAHNVLDKISRQNFFAPGSIVKMNLDLRSQLTYGMQSSVSAYISDPVALALDAYPRKIDEVGLFPQRALLESGWLVGGQQLFGKAALADIPVGKGRVVLYAFRVQHRAQTYGTFKLLFNALYR